MVVAVLAMRNKGCLSCRLCKVRKIADLLVRGVSLRFHWLTGNRCVVASKEADRLADAAPRRMLFNASCQRAMLELPSVRV